MPRSPRIEYSGAVYHVMCRGDRREPIFRTDADRLLMLDTLSEVHERTGWLVHSYVLMPNHYHFLLETPEPNLVSGMKWFQGTYTQRFNLRHKVSGHLFAGRYKAIPVEAEEPGYFRKVSDYIHLNPARAHLLNAEHPDLEAFRWSSYPAFVNESKLPDWLERRRVFSSLILPDEGRGSRRRYAARMKKRVQEICEADESERDADEWKELRRGWFLGSNGFRNQLQDRIDQRMRGHRRDSYTREGCRLHDERQAEKLLEAALCKMGIDLSELQKRKQVDPVKQGIAWLIKAHTVVGDRWICDTLAMGARVNISRAVNAFQDSPDRERTVLKKEMLQCTD